MFSAFPGLPQPPAWAVQEAQRRVVLLLNHVLQQELEAMRRMQGQAGRIALLRWREFEFKLAVTKAGLFDLADAVHEPHLTFAVLEDSPLALAQTLLAGDKPALRIEGDVQLAADVNWLAEYVRWDVEEDLARVIGDAPAHGLTQVVRRVAEGLRGWLASRKVAVVS